MSADGLLCRHQIAGKTLPGAEASAETSPPAGPAENVADAAPVEAEPSRRSFLVAAATATVGAAAATAAAGVAAAGAVVVPRSVPPSSADNAPPAGAATGAGDIATPIGPPWWPSRWGADDQAGASNWMTPEKVLQAVRLIRSGKVYEMGRIAREGMPLFGGRGFVLRTVGSPTGGPFGSNKIVWNDEFLATEIGQVGTYLDGLGHRLSGGSRR
jgi:hypothetical protein